MKKYEVVLQGITPILMNSNRMLGRHDGTKKRSGEAVKGDSEEWREKMYFKPEIGLYCPSLNVEKCFAEAAKGIKISGREFAGRYFNGAIFVEDMEIPILLNGSKVMDVDAAIASQPELIGVDSRPAYLKNGMKKTAQLRYRLEVGRAGSWSMKFILIDASDGMVSMEKIEETITKAGLLYGLFDWRPRYGRFQLKKITEV